MSSRKCCCFAVAIVLAGVVSKVTAQNPLPQQVTVKYNSLQLVTVPINDGISTLVGLSPDQTVTVIVYYLATQAAQSVNIEALDGGTILRGLYSFYKC
jgi:hypothetical protein